MLLRWYVYDVFLLQPEPVTTPEGDGEGGEREQRDAQTARKGGAHIQSV